MVTEQTIGTVIFMSKEKKPMSRGRKIGIGVAAALVTAAVVGIGVFYCTFFPNPLAKRIAPADISAGERSVTGESNVLVAYFSIANNRIYPEGEVDAVSSASLTIRDGKGCMGEKIRKIEVELRFG